LDRSSVLGFYGYKYEVKLNCHALNQVCCVRGRQREFKLHIFILSSANPLPVAGCWIKPARLPLYN
jgi:hypothetical protein